MSAFDFSLLAKGGPIMVVVVLLAFLFVVIFVERTLFLHRAQIRSKPFLDGIKNILEKRRIVEATTVCEETPGPVAAVVKAALVHAGEDAEKLRFAVQEAAVVELPSLERRLGAIAAIAQVAPLVGLLGTMVGLITTFSAFTQGGQYGTAHALAGGLWQALLVSAGSIMIAILCNLGYHFLNSRVRGLVRDVEWAGNEIMRYLLSEYRDGETGLPPPVRTAPLVVIDPVTPTLVRTPVNAP